MDEISWLKRTLQGIAIGLANVVPGISGGTIALILGIYKRLIFSINTLPLKLPLKLLKGEDIRQDWRSIDFRFLAPLAMGVIIATILLARIMEHLLASHSNASYSFFVGLILASLVLVYRYMDSPGPWEIAMGILGFAVTFLLTGGQLMSGAHTPVTIFAAGAFAIASMILPGISGSSVLVLMGEYDHMLHALNTLDIGTIMIFISGGLIGLFGLARLLEYLLKRSTSVTMAFIFGLVFGGLREPLGTALAGDPPVHMVVIPAVIGATLLLAMEYYRYSVTSD